MKAIKTDKKKKMCSPMAAENLLDDTVSPRAANNS